MITSGNAAGAAVAGGAGLLCDGVSVDVLNCIFADNDAPGNGGGIYGEDASLSVANCIFRGNVAASGGGAFCTGTAEFVNCAFTGNAAELGGAVGMSGTNVQLVNCILWGNDATTAGRELSAVASATVVVTHTDIQGGVGDASDAYVHSDGTAVVSDNGGNMDADPLFAGTPGGDVALTASSPCIDAADGDAAPATDLAGSVRHDDPGMEDSGSGSVSYADLGALEFGAVSYHSISGLVTGAVASGVTVTLSGTAAGSAVSDAGGTYHFTGLVNGSYAVRPELLGYGFTPTDATVTVTDADETAAEFVSAALPRYTLSGHIVGDEIEGVTVTAGGIVTESAVSDADGCYLITGLLTGEYAVSCALSGYEFQPDDASIDIAACDVAGINFTAFVEVSPTPATMTALQDARVNRSARDMTYGADTTLEIQGDNSTDWPQASVLEFDLAGVPARATVHDATLHVYCSLESPTKGGTFSVHGLNQAWTEATVTYDDTGAGAWLGGDFAFGGVLDAVATDSLVNQASVDGSGGSNPYYTAGAFPAGDDWAGCWIEWDVSALVQQWVDGTRSNCGLAVVCQARVPNPDGHALFDRNYGYMHTEWHSREGTNAPKFVLSYTPEVVTYAITATAGANGTIAPLGTVNVIAGSDQVFIMTTDAGCEIVDVLVDGVSAGAIPTHTFTSVSADHALSVTFHDPAATPPPEDGDEGGCAGNAGNGASKLWLLIGGASCLWLLRRRVPVDSRRGSSS